MNLLDTISIRIFSRTLARNISRYMRKPSQNSKEDIRSGRTPYTSMTMYVIYMVFHTLEQKLYGFQKISETYLNSGKYTAAIDNKVTNNAPREEIPGRVLFAG